MSFGEGPHSADGFPLVVEQREGRGYSINPLLLERRRYFRRRGGGMREGCDFQIATFGLRLSDYDFRIMTSGLRLPVVRCAGSGSRSKALPGG